jgi:rhodanese-related sulfurtransferase
MSFLKTLLALFTGGDASEKLTAPAFKEALEAGTRPQLIDVRTPAEFKSGHIKGARNLDVTSSSFHKGISGLDKNRPVLLYCRSGSRSAMALGRIKGAGFTEVRHLAGGIGAWMGSGLPTVR